MIEGAGTRGRFTEARIALAAFAGIWLLVTAVWLFLPEIGVETSIMAFGWWAVLVTTVAEQVAERQHRG